MKEYIYPSRVICENTGINTANLLKIQPMQIGLAERFTTRFDDGDHVILDFGKELCGGVRILTFSSGMVKVRLRFGESISETCAEIGGEKNATNDHALRDFETNLPRFSDMSYGNTGFRFLRIDFFGRVDIKSIVAQNNILDLAPVYEYRGADERIRAIFETAKRTVDLCASCGYVWDGIKRDRLVWIGDMHPEMLALTTLYGRMDEIERSLDFIKEQTPIGSWMNNMPMYSMWWIIILADYYEKTGFAEFITGQLDYLEALIEQTSGCVKESGELAYPSYFVDWPTHKQPDEIFGVRAINIIAMKKASALLAHFGKDTSLAQSILERLLKVDITPTHAKQVAGLKYFATDLTDADKKLLTNGCAKGVSTFMSYYILKAVASFDKELAIKMMKEYYGAMLDKGATTFFEDFDIEWAENSCRIDEFPKEGERDIHGDFGAFCYVGYRHSLCHGWSAGVIQFIKEECE